MQTQVVRRTFQFQAVPKANLQMRFSNVGVLREQLGMIDLQKEALVISEVTPADVQNFRSSVGVLRHSEAALATLKTSYHPDKATLHIWVK